MDRGGAYGLRGHGGALELTVKPGEVSPGHFVTFSFCLSGLLAAWTPRIHGTGPLSLDTAR